jgi:NitT/TauT family transport system substrate-binding protein
MPSQPSRRQVLLGAAGASLLAACGTRGGDALRFGFMTNLTHAPAIAGSASGRLAQALGLRIDATPFRAGPRVVEALIGGAIDVGVAGPASIVYTLARHGDGALRVLSGCASGGASLVVARRAGIQGAEDLRGKVLATPQIGTTQDIALRKYLRAHGYEPAERGGDVTIHALDASTIFTEIARGALDGAWLPEPWATRVVLDADAVRLVDERDLWPRRAFPTALVVARGDFVRGRPALAARFADAIGAEVDRALAAPSQTLDVVGAELGRVLGKALPRALLERAAPFVDFTRDPLPDALETMAGDAAALGLAPATSCRSLFG